MFKKLTTTRREIKKMDAKQLLLLVIRPILLAIGHHSIAAEELILGTVFQESRGRYLQQIKGPALGLIQMEPATHKDIWVNYLNYRSALFEKVEGLMSCNALDYLATHGHPPHEELITNLAYAVAMCRIHYLRVKESLPNEGELRAQGAYWKKHYNTQQGKGLANNYVQNYPFAPEVIYEKVS